MIAPVDLIVIASAEQTPARCVVCAGDIATGEGVTAGYRGRWLRFKCSGCVSRFRADPERFLIEHPDGCCTGGHAETSPASEWTCD